MYALSMCADDNDMCTSISSVKASMRMTSTSAFVRELIYHHNTVLQM